MKNYKSDKLLIELISNQRKNIPIEKKLSYNDLKRISKYLLNSIIGLECSIWNGYITVVKNDEKNSYINFYFNGKKYALHRLLYVNYIGELADSEYIKFNCDNKGKCCNIKHFYKIIKNNDDISSKGSTRNSDVDELLAIDNIETPAGSFDEDNDSKKPDTKLQITKNIIVDFDL
jgi:hypothetical protein